jgi:hypothetical protein
VEEEMKVRFQIMAVKLNTIAGSSPSLPVSFP